MNDIPVAVHLPRLKDLVAVLPTAFEESLIINSKQRQKTCKSANVESNRRHCRRDVRAYEFFPSFCQKGRYASGDWRSEIQA